MEALFFSLSASHYQEDASTGTWRALQSPLKDWEALLGDPALEAAGRLLGLPALGSLFSVHNHHMLLGVQKNNIYSLSLMLFEICQVQVQSEPFESRALLQMENCCWVLTLFLELVVCFGWGEFFRAFVLHKSRERAGCSVSFSHKHPCSWPCCPSHGGHY